MNPGNRELIFVFVSMGVILIFAIGAVVIFLKVMRREKRERLAALERERRNLKDEGAYEG